MTLQAMSTVHIVPVDSIHAVTQWCKQQVTPLGMDTETTGLDPLVHKVVTIQLGNCEQQYVIDTRGYYALADEDKATVRQNLQELFSSIPVCVGHNLKFDLKMLAANFGVKVPVVVDTMLQEQVIHGVGMNPKENRGIAVNMLATAARYGLTVGKDLQTWSVDLDTRTEWFMPYPEDFVQYCVQDVKVPLIVQEYQNELLAAHSLEHVASLENLCVPVFARMELDGCYVDVTRWRTILEKKTAQRDKIEPEVQSALDPFIQDYRQQVFEAEDAEMQAWELAISQAEEQLAVSYQQDTKGMTWGKYKVAGLKVFREEHPRPKTPKRDTSPINLGSHVQLKLALEAIGVFVPKTDKEHLAPYKSDPRVAKLLEWKNLSKFITTYGENVLARIASDNRIHPNYNQIGAATGRTACLVPNWQNLPSHEPEDTSIRRCVIAEPGRVILTADFSNIEARILAEVSQDEALLNFFEQGGDLHCYTARLMFSLDNTDSELKGTKDTPPLEIRPGLSFRSVAKTINFGLVYGMSASGLAKSLGVPKHEAQELMNTYFSTFQGVAAYLASSSQLAIEQGYSTTIAGRKRFYPVIPEPVYNRHLMTWEDYRERYMEYRIQVGEYERQAKNAPIQGTSADITKYALILLNRRLPDCVDIVTCVHDEIVLECPVDMSAAIAKLLSTAMYKACKKYMHTVYIPPVDVSIETYWKKD